MFIYKLNQEKILKCYKILLSCQEKLIIFYDKYFFLFINYNHNTELNLF